MNLYVLAGIVCGIMAGITFCLLFFQQSKLSLTFTSAGGPGIYFFIVFNIAKEQNIILGKSDVLGFLISFFLFMIIVVIIGFLIMNNLLKNNRINDGNKYNLNLMDFILSNKKTFDNYADAKKKEIDNVYDLDTVKEANENLNKKKSAMGQIEQALYSREKKIEEMLEKGVFLFLPLDQKLPVDNSFIEQLPRFIDKLCNYIQEMDSIKEKLIKDWSNSEKALDNDIITVLYILENICNYVGEYLFNIHDVRVQFRYLNLDNNYTKVISMHKGKEYEDDLKKIKCDTGMIYQAGKLRRTLIKSLNDEYHLQGSSDNRWPDYMVLVFDSFYKENKPLLTMDICVKNPEVHKNMMYFLNYCNFEIIIDNYLSEINKKINITETINELNSGISTEVEMA